MTPGRLSVLIPARNERFLQPTIRDVLAKAAGDVEIVVVLDGYWPDPQLEDHPRVTVLHHGQSVGMRNAINHAALVATGRWLMKLDAHCMLDYGFDEVLTAECDDNWVVVPRRYSLDPEAWAIKRDKEPIDAHYLSWPYVDPDSPGLHGRWWKERSRGRKDVLVDDEMTSQGSCWMMSRRHWDWLGGLHTQGYGDFIQEFQEIGCKTWLGGGAVKVNRRTWYAHLHKGKTYGRGYFLSRRSWHVGCRYSADLWLNNRWPDRVHDFEWLVEKFWPVPSWPANWRGYDHAALARTS